MKKPTKVLMGLATLWPFFFLILFLVVIFATIVFVPGSGEPGPPRLIALILPLHLFTMLASAALIVFYIVMFSKMIELRKISRRCGRRDDQRSKRECLMYL